jgi:hypothetical protein
VRSLSPTGCLRANNRFPSRGGGLRLEPTRQVMRTPFQDLAWGPFRLGALKILVRAFLVFGLSAGARATAQGLVNVNNRGLTPAQLVTLPDGSPVVGNNFVAQIVYGPDSGSLTNKLGDPMPFRVSTTVFPGTWNPGAASVRTLNGFLPGQVVSMQVWVWDSASFSELGIAQEAYRRFRETGDWSWGCRDGGHLGVSAVFTQVVGTSEDPSSQQLSNFRGFRVEPTVEIYPPRFTENALGGPWLGSISVPEDTLEVNINLLAQPGLTLPSSIRGDEPVGSVVRSIAAGNPYVFWAPSGLRFPAVSSMENPGMSNVFLGTDQGRVDIGVVSVEGTVSNAVVRLSHPLSGRIEFMMRYPIEEETPQGCLIPRKFVVDFAPYGASKRIWATLSGADPVVRMRIDTWGPHRLMRSTDLRTGEEVALGYVGIWICPVSSCGAYGDLDDKRRGVDFVVPAGLWQRFGRPEPVFLRLE